jgi:hypothetical protein
MAGALAYGSLCILIIIAFWKRCFVSPLFGSLAI